MLSIGLIFGEHNIINNIELFIYIIILYNYIIYYGIL
jgi:hypothetical protein